MSDYLSHILIGLCLLASLSPILTLSRLWQVKEWRIDRLRENFVREEGMLQLVGIIRPVVILGLGVLEISDVLPDGMWIPMGLGVLALLSVVQVVLGKQPMPVWTQKALSIVGLSILETFVLCVLIYRILPEVLPLLPLVQSVMVFIAWGILLPVDRALKQGLIQKALLAREAHPDVLVIGITGSVGKTTTKEILAHLLAPKGAVATPAYMNAEIGLARWFTVQLSKETPPPILIVEMGAYRKGEIALLAKMTKPSMGVITFIGSQHLGLFGSQEALIEAKGELLRALPADGTAFPNGDSSLCASMKPLCTCTVVMIGTGGSADLEAFDIEEAPAGIRFRVGNSSVEVPLNGTHNVTNVLLAMAVAERVRMSRADVIQRLRSFTPLSHTFSVRTQRGVTVLDDTHNASAASFRAAIEWAHNHTGEPKVLITPGLIELGEEHDRTHAELGALSARVFDRVIFTQKHGRKSFMKGYGKDVELLKKNTQSVAEKSLLVCVGRIAPSVIIRLLPAS